MRRPWRWIAVAALAAIALGSSSRAFALVSQDQARRAGLTRAWFAQVGAPRSTGAINHINYLDGMLLAQTDKGMLTALDAETGRTLWSMQVGPRGLLTSEAASNKEYVAVVSGSTLYLLDRVGGSVRWQRRLRGAPGAGPALSETRVFVPMIDGMVEAYSLEAGDRRAPWVHKSAGRILVPPMVTGQSVSWTTERGHYYVADPNAGGIRYRLETRDAIRARPGYWTPNLYAGSTDGFVYAVDEASGAINWKFSIGDAIYESPVAINDKVFAVSELLGMTCLDSKAVSELWVAPGIKQFLSASPTRVYACDNLGRLTVLDINTGSRVATMPLAEIALKVCNSHTDRVYLAGNSGVVECLREIELRKPAVYTPPPPAPPEVKAKLRERPEKPAAEPKEESTPDEAPEAMPDAPAAAGDESPAMEEEKPEAPAAADADDPFK